MRGRAAGVVAMVAALLPFAVNACTGFQADSADADGGAPTTGIDAATGGDGGRADAPTRPDALGDFDAPGDPADASADTTAPVPVGCNGSVVCERYVFVTAQATLTGSSLGGLAGADAICNAAAKASLNPVMQGRAFVAWLSSSVEDAKNRHAHGSKAYKRVDGVVVASDFLGIVSGNLMHPITTDERGNVVGSHNVITGTGAAGGVFSTETCGDWALPSTITVAGDTTRADTGWTNATSGFSCAAQGHIYCFEK